MYCLVASLEELEGNVDLCALRWIRRLDRPCVEAQSSLESWR